MWKAVRVTVALAVLALFALSFINLNNAEPAAWEHAVERIQLTPAALGTLSGLAGAGLVLVALLVITLIFGRVYCSFICPLGILQDIVIRLRRVVDRLRGKERKGAAIRYAEPVPWVRYIVLIVTLLSIVGGVTLLLTWLDPYTISARLAAAVLNPLTYELLGEGAAQWGRYGVAVGIIVFFGLVPLALAWWKGRLYCNTICPVGALLGLLSRRPLMRIGMDADACVLCGKCLKACKANCIDLKTHCVDTSRCVNCYNCVSACDNGLRPRLTNPFRSPVVPKKAKKKPQTPAPEAAAEPNRTRRAFLGAMLCSVPAAALTACKSGSAEEVSENPATLGDNEAAATTPPGSISVPRFLDRCTGCGLCITACPTHVLQPSLTQHGLRGMMKPYLNFTKGFCNFDCNICSTVCPEGAILPLALPEKKQTQIALAEFHRELCIVQRNHTECGACTEHCPTKALYTKEGRFPTCSPESCIGCASCVGVCPAKAISLQSGEGGKQYAVIDNAKCVACGKCGRVCPTQAISLRDLLIPELAPELCIGCGACTYACPVRPERAMQLTPRAKHLRAEVHREAPAENPVSQDDFPF